MQIVSVQCPACGGVYGGRVTSKFITCEYCDTRYALGRKELEDVYLIHDDTIFGSGKNGFAITQRGLYCRDFGEPTAHFVSWEDFANGERPELDDSNIFQNGTSLGYFTGNKQLRDKKLTSLFNQLFEHARWL